MATRTFVHSVFGGGLVTVEFDINDANWRMTQIRCINNSASMARAMIYEGATLRYTANGSPNRTSTWNTTGVQMGWDAVDGGLLMGNYTMFCGWPA